MKLTNYTDYAPLPVFLTIKQSNIHGLGLFTIQDIEQGTDLGPSHYLCKDGFIRLPLGGFVNHSNTPNLKLIRKNGTRFFHAVTIKFIHADSELTGEYL